MTGEKKLDSPDREKLRKDIRKVLGYPEPRIDGVTNPTVENLIALFELLIKEAKTQEKINTLRELRDMWAYEQAAGSAVMAVRLDRWVEYCHSVGIEDDWWELKEE